MVDTCAKTFPEGPYRGLLRPWLGSTVGQGIVPTY